MLAYFLYTRTITSHYNYLRLSTNMFSKLIWFLREPIWQFGLNPWAINPSSLSSLFLFTIIALAVFLKTKRDKPESGILLSSVKLVLIVGLYVLSCLPIVISAQAGHAYRSTPGPYLLTSILLLLSINELARHFPRRLGNSCPLLLGLVMFVTSSIIANYNIGHLIAEAPALEIRFIKSALQQTDLRKIRHIHIIKPDISKGLVSFVTYRTWVDEFGVAATAHGQDIFPIMLGIFANLGIKKENCTITRSDEMLFNSWVISFSTAQELPKLLEPALIIDMNRLQHFY
ncbi:MAG: hypothetical protein HY537_11740 [Deltaproteobacteria bacterium]|nr:hypothetical protein [Deltaproteobacteria bacterium]